MKIFLIGFMGSGKSTAGKILAEALGYSFIDLDEAIENGENKTIREIFEQEGEPHFRVLEAQYLKALKSKDNIVIATGGGTPCHNDLIKWMNDEGMTIYLQATVDQLELRLRKEMSERPLLMDKDPSELRQYIKDTLAKRDADYNKAKMKLPATGTDWNTIAKRLKNLD